MTPWHRLRLTRSDWLALPLAVRLYQCAALYVGWGYARTHPRTPFGAPGIPSSLVTDAKSITNCSTLTASIVMAMRPDRPWSQDEWADLQVWDASRLASPIEAVERMDVGDVVRYPSRAGGVYLMQGWRNGRSGHAFLGHAADDGRVAVLDSGLDVGPRWRWLTPVQLAGMYPHALHVARLR